MRSRLLVAAVGVPLILLVVLWAPLYVLTAVLALLCAVGAAELMRCVGGGECPALTAACALCAAVPAVLTWLELPFWGVLGVVWTMLLFACAVWRAGELKFQQIMAALFSVVAVPYALTAFLRLAHMGYRRGFLLLPLVFSFASDTGAFFAGSAFGKHKLTPKVSPHKTVEGSLGGLALNAVAGVVFALVMNRWFDCALSCWRMAVLGIFTSVVAQLGDLSFSLIKREFGIKDYGHIFLAHGGVLDRFDSVIFVAPVLAALLPALGL